MLLKDSRNISPRVPETFHQGINERKLAGICKDLPELSEDIYYQVETEILTVNRVSCIFEWAAFIPFLTIFLRYYLPATIKI
jgi:hypothetical protein